MKRNRTDLFVLVALFLTTHFFYWRSWKAGFISDFTGLMERLDGSPFSDVLNCFGFPSMSQVLNFFLYLIYQAFGTAPLPWYLIHTSLHVLNAFLLYRLLRFAFAKWELRQPMLWAVGAAFFFLLLPYQSEVLVWKVCLNFLLSGLWLLLILGQVFQYWEHGKQRHLWLAHSIFLLALFTFELALTIPFILLFFSLAWHFRFGQAAFQGGSLKSNGLYLHLPQFSMLGLYFLLNKLVLGSWVGHYGESVHLQFKLSAVLATLFKYLSKVFLLARYFPHTRKEYLFSRFDQPIWLWGLVIAGLIVAVIYLLRFRKWAAGGQLAGLFLLSGMFALLPVLNLYFNYLLLVENDRYTYFASLFLMPALAAGLAALPRWLSYSLGLIYVLACGWLLYKTTSYWQESAQVQEALMDGFEWTEQSEVYILGMPDNYKGIVLYRDMAEGNRGFRDALRYLRGRDIKGQLHEVVKFNMNAPMEGVSPRMTSDSTIQVKLNQWGCWWWRKGRGALNYETPNYKFEKLDLEYQLQLKKIAPDAVFLYQDSLQFKVFPLN